MKKNQSLKLLPWSKKDVALLAVTFVANILVFLGLFLLLAYVNFSSQAEKLNEVLNLGTVSSFLVMLFFVMAGMFLYFWFEDRDFLKKASNFEMLFLILQLAIVACFLTKTFINPYLRPLALVGVITLFLTNTKHAIFTNFIFAIFLLFFECFITASTIEYVSVTLLLICSICSGVMGIYLMKDVYSRFNLLMRGFLLSVPISLNYVIQVLKGSSVFEWQELVSAIVSGVFSVGLVIVLLPIMEFIFKKITCFKLAELTDHKAKYVKKMIATAPGTFNHAIVVSNLAEACATAIGEDALLARTCAYYHDIGKLRRPEFFKENQVDGSNPHDDITPELSANIIKSHTVDGYSYAKKNFLPQEVADAIIQHHGTLPILYFYDKAKKFTDGEVSLAQYCYAGPKPQTKIAAILMIADSCEAASRLLTERSRENVEKTVKGIVNDRMKLGQFDECEITLKELNIICHTIINTLSGVYHNRIAYPKVSVEDLDLNSTLKKQES